MDFANAHKELLNGKRIRRKAWEPLQHLVLVDGEIKSYKGEHSDFYGGLDMMISSGWKTKDDNEKMLTFLEALEALKNKKKVYNENWKEDIFIFVDVDKFAICIPVECNFMPSFKCFCANDWEIIK